MSNAKGLVKFVQALVNYDLFMFENDDEAKLVESGLKFFVALEELDYDEARKQQAEFQETVIALQLEGTQDLVDPVLRINIPIWSNCN